MQFAASGHPSEPDCEVARYRAALSWLQGFADYERHPGGHRFSLDRPRELLRTIGDPQCRFRSIVIAGTKGKGSTAVMAQALLRAAGHSVGLYTQPHLHTYRERIRIGDELISEGEVADGLERLKPAVDALHQQAPQLGRLTTYEIGTALAFTYFAERHVDWAVLEVGLGGRLDAVNTVDSSVAVLTPISYDHTDVLGSTIEQIAGEKAGIIHPGGTVISAPQTPQAQRVIEQACRERSARLSQVEDRTVASIRLHRLSAGASLEEMRSRPLVEFELGDDRSRYALPLGGRHQALNAAVALAAVAACGVRAEPGRAAEALRSIQWPGRLEILAARPALVADGAHNGASAEHLAKAVRAHFNWRRLAVVLGTSADKDLDAILAPLAPLADRLIATQASQPRARPADEVAARASLLGVSATVTAGVGEAIDLAASTAQPEDLILVAGSLFVTAEARGYAGLRTED